MNYSGRVMELSVDWGAAELRNQAAEITAEADVEIAELRRDAERYRWLRSAPSHSIRWTQWEVRQWRSYWEMIAHAELDEAIDAARGGE